MKKQNLSSKPFRLWLATWNLKGIHCKEIFWKKKQAVNFCSRYENVKIYPAEVRKISNRYWR